MKTTILVLIATLTSLTAQAAPGDILGLMCDDSRSDGKVEIETSISGRKGSLLFRDPFTLRVLGAIEVPKKIAQTILNGDLGTLNKVSAQDRANNASIAMRVDGADVEQKPRLAILVDFGDRQMKLSSCSLVIERADIMDRTN